MKTTGWRSIMAALVLAVAGFVPSTGWAFSGTTKVQLVGSWFDGHVVAVFEGVTSSANCGSPTQFSLGTPTDAKQKAMIEIAMSALLSGKSVEVVTDGSCQGGQERVTWLAVK